MNSYTLDCSSCHKRYGQDATVMLEIGARYGVCGGQCHGILVVVASKLDGKMILMGNPRPPGSPDVYKPAERDYPAELFGVPIMVRDLGIQELRQKMVDEVESSFAAFGKEAIRANAHEFTERIERQIEKRLKKLAEPCKNKDGTPRIYEKNDTPADRFKRANAFYEKQAKKDPPPDDPLWGPDQDKLDATRPDAALRSFILPKRRIQ